MIIKSPYNKLVAILVLFAAILISYAPIIYIYLALVQKGVSQNDVLVFYIFPFSSFFIMLVSVIVLKKFPQYHTFNIRWFGNNKLKDILWGVLLAIIIFTSCFSLRYMLKMLNVPAWSNEIHPMTSGLIFLIFYTIRVALVGPVIEEVFWRGYVQDVLQKTLNKYFGLFAQATLFAILHFQSASATIQLFFLGLILGLWRLRRQTLIPLIIAHIFFNSAYCAINWYNYMELRNVKSTKDYRIELEKLNKPEDYSIEKDAWPNYKKAFDLLTEIPEGLNKNILKKWPSDLSNDQMNLIQDWISSNQQVIAELEAGANKPYYFYPSDETLLGRDAYPEMSKVHPMVLLLLSRAQISAFNGDFSRSISDILICYRFGLHSTGPIPLLEQLVGLAVTQMPVESSFRILQRTNHDDIWLRDLQSNFETLSKTSLPYIDFSGEKLICLDLIQKTFTDDGGGEGHIPRGTIRQFKYPPPYLKAIGISEIKTVDIILWSLLKRSKTTQLTENLFTYLKSVEKITPIELRRSNKNITKSIKRIVNGNIFLLTLTEPYENIYNISFRFNAQIEGLIVTVAMFRYRLEQGDLPDNLEQLVQAGYMAELPLDPYSGLPFVYKKLDSDDFLLYSLGLDFDDDGGTRSDKNMEVYNGDEIIWPREGN